MRSAEVVVAGAGIAGVTAAWQLAVRHGMRGVVLVDERAPLSLTSGRGTEAYRNWWPGPDDAMVRLMGRSIDLLDDLARATGNAIRLTRRGYAYMTADPTRAGMLASEAEAVCAMGAGELRRDAWEPARDDLDGADLVLDPSAIRRAFPFLAPDTVALLHVRRAGWLDARALGAHLLAEARAAGVEVVRGRLEAVDAAGGRVSAVRLEPGGAISTRALVLAPGPYLERALAMVECEIPVATDVHGKAAFDDERNVVPRDAPLLIWCDPVALAWKASERAELERADPLLGRLPAGVHVRPRGDGDEILIVWTYQEREEAPRPEPAFPSNYGEILVRGLARMIPSFAGYFGSGARARVDGGYYCRVPDNRPRIGPLPLEGAFACAALSGFGIMASQAAGDLLAAHVAGAALPGYAPAFHPDRFEDPAYVARVREADAREGEL